MPTSRRILGQRAIVATAAIALGAALAVAHAGAQTQSVPFKAVETKPEPEMTLTIFLKHASEQNSLNDIQTDLRNILPRTKIYGVSSQNAITLRGTHEDLETAQKLVAELDQPKALYRLTYTIIDSDGGKRTGAQHFVVLAAVGQRSVFKHGSRIPIVTGNSEGHGSQVQYADAGLNIEADLAGSAQGLTLRTRVEQSNLSDDQAGTISGDPVIHQTTLEETTQLVAGKPIVLGALDIPGGTRHEEVEVVAEPAQ